MDAGHRTYLAEIGGTSRQGSRCLVASGMHDGSEVERTQLETEDVAVLVGVAQRGLKAHPTPRTHNVVEELDSELGNGSTHDGTGIDRVMQQKRQRQQRQRQRRQRQRRWWMDEENDEARAAGAMRIKQCNDGGGISMRGAADIYRFVVAFLTSAALISSSSPCNCCCWPFGVVVVVVVVVVLSSLAMFRIKLAFDAGEFPLPHSNCMLWLVRCESWCRFLTWCRRGRLVFGWRALALHQ
jgi:hypothetical protein